MCVNNYKTICTVSSVHLLWSGQGIPPTKWSCVNDGPWLTICVNKCKVTANACHCNLFRSLTSLSKEGEGGTSWKMRYDLDSRSELMIKVRGWNTSGLSSREIKTVSTEVDVSRFSQRSHFNMLLYVPKNLKLMNTYLCNWAWTIIWFKCHTILTWHWKTTGKLVECIVKWRRH